MRSKLALVAAIAITITTVGAWAVSSGFSTHVSTAAATPCVIDTYSLHVQANVADLPVQSIEGLI